MTLIGTMYRSETGVTAHSVRLDVIGNNISNINTSGYKSQNSSFAEIYNETIRQAEQPEAGKGGLNPLQKGYGVRVAATGLNFSQGALLNTGKDLDFAISGKGFYIIDNPINDFTGTTDQYLYTRDGTFEIDVTDAVNGNVGLEMSDGARLQGYNATLNAATGLYEIPATPTLESLKLNIASTFPAFATNNMYMAGNLDANAPKVIEPINLSFTKNGQMKNLQLRFTHLNPTLNRYLYRVYDKDTIDTATDDYELLSADSKSAGVPMEGVIELDNDGRVIAHYTNTAGTDDYIDLTKSGEIPTTSASYFAQSNPTNTGNGYDFLHVSISGANVQTTNNGLAESVTDAGILNLRDDFLSDDFVTTASTTNPDIQYIEGVESTKITKIDSTSHYLQLDDDLIVGSARRNPDNADGDTFQMYIDGELWVNRTSSGSFTANGKEYMIDLESGGIVLNPAGTGVPNGFTPIATYAHEIKDYSNTNGINTKESVQVAGGWASPIDIAAAMGVPGPVYVESGSISITDTAGTNFVNVPYFSDSLDQTGAALGASFVNPALAANEYYIDHNTTGTAQIIMGAGSQTANPITITFNRYTSLMGTNDGWEVASVTDQREGKVQLQMKNGGAFVAPNDTNYPQAGRARQVEMNYEWDDTAEIVVPNGITKKTNPNLLTDLNSEDFKFEINEDKISKQYTDANIVSGLALTAGQATTLSSVDPITAAPDSTLVINGVTYTSVDSPAFALNMGLNQYYIDKTNKTITVSEDAAVGVSKSLTYNTYSEETVSSGSSVEITNIDVLGKEIPTKTTVFDSDGNEHEVTLVFEHIDTNRFAYIARTQLNEKLTSSVITDNAVGGGAAQDGLKLSDMGIAVSNINSNLYDIVLTTKESGNGNTVTWTQLPVGSVFPTTGSGSNYFIVTDNASGEIALSRDITDASAEINASYVVNTVSAQGVIAFDSNGRFLTDTTYPEQLVSPSAQNNGATSTGIYIEPTLAAVVDVALNFQNTTTGNEITGFASSSDPVVTERNGYRSGSFKQFDYDQTGRIWGKYDNGRSQVLGQIPLQLFTNPAGLQKVGDNRYLESANSGKFVAVSLPGQTGAGLILGRMVEGSNVDLAFEFANLIITQRGFQSNSRVIKAADDLMREALSIKR